MTVESTTGRVAYVGDGTSVNFPIPFGFYAVTDISAFVDGSELSGGYSVSGAGANAGTFSLASPLASGSKLQIILDPPISQLVNLANGTGFQADVINQINDRIVQVALRLQDQVNRCIKAPDGDLAPVMALQSAAARANLVPSFDANGNLALALNLPAGSLTQSVFNTFAANSPGQQQTPAEAAAGVTVVNGNYGELNLLRYLYAVAVDIYSAMSNALLVAAQKGGGRITVPAGAYTVASASLATPWQIPSNTKISGAGLTCCFITVTGTSQTSSVWASTDTSNVEIEGIYHTGNCQANAFAVGNCFSYTVSGALAPTRNIRIHDCGFSNFKGDYWLFFYVSAAQQCYNPLVYNNVFLSQTGNARDGTNRGVPSACVAFQGSSTSASGYFVGARVYDNVADCTYMKQFCIHWHGNYSGEAYNNWVVANGTSSQINDDTAAYAFLAYDNAGIGTNPSVKWSDNYVGATRSCGFYGASGGNIELYDNFVGGQTDVNNGTIPKGAYALNQCLNVAMTGNAADSCYFGIDLVGMLTGGTYKVDGLKVTNTRAGGTAGIFTPLAANTVDTLQLTNLYADATGTGSSGVIINATSTYGFTRLLVDGFKITANSNGLQIFSPDSTVSKLRDVEIRNGSVAGFNGSGVTAAGLTDSLTRLTIQGIKFSGAGNTSTHLNVAASLNATLSDLEFCDYNSGTGNCFNAVGTHGRLANVQFSNVAPSFRFAASSLGLAQPTWTGGANDFVQNLDLAEGGTTGSKYQTLGWNWDVTNSKWNGQRALTGN